MAWWECWLSTPVSCDHGIIHLDCWSLEIFLIFGGFVHIDSDPLGLSSCGAFVHFCFSLCVHVMAWQECWLSTPVSCDHLIVHLNCWSLKIFSHFWSFYPPWFWSFGAFCPVVLLSILAFLCTLTWWHDENVDCPHLYHVIMGSYTLIVGVLKYFLIFGGFVRLDSDPLIVDVVLWFFRPFLLFSFRPRDGMTRMLIVHTCIMWSWDRTPCLLKS